jgi:hypothetical protein
LAKRPAVDIAAAHNWAAASAALAIAALLDLRIVHAAEGAQIIEPVFGRGLALLRAGPDMVHMRCRAATAADGAAIAIALQRSAPQRFPMRSRVIAVLCHLGSFAGAAAQHPPDVDGAREMIDKGVAENLPQELGLDAQLGC